MKTIEERAKMAARVCIDWCVKEDHEDENGVTHAIQNALIDQRKIDEEEFDSIQQENILKALEKQKKIDTEKAELNFCIFCSSYDNCDARYSCETFEKFCKAIGG